MTRKRIAIAGFQHETNTFAPFTADLAAFAMADSWPELLRGHDVITKTRGLNLPIAGAVTGAEAADVTLLPILWCAAEPSGPVTDAAFDTICAEILAGLEAGGRIDGLYLDLHGAMVTESHDDGQAELVRRIRAHMGSDLPIVASLDLHANLSPGFAQLVDAVTIFRTYPHLDMATTGMRAMQTLLNILDEGPLCHSLAPIPFLVPLQAQFTGEDPCQALYAMLDQVASDPREYVEIAMGFTAADVPSCGPSVIAYAATEDRAKALSKTVADAICGAKRAFKTDLLPPGDAIAKAAAMPGPVVLADVQDNPGAGASSDTTGLLTALIKADCADAVLGVFCDPEVAARAHEYGPKSVFDAQLGGKVSPVGGPPLYGRFRVLALSDGHIPYCGEMYGGGIAQTGSSCLLRVEGPQSDIRIVVSSVRTQCLDRGFFTHFGVDLGRVQIIGVKSTVHFRADFEDLAKGILNVAAPGLFPCDLSHVTYVKAARRKLAR